MSAGLLPYPRMKEMRQYTRGPDEAIERVAGLAIPEGTDDACGERP